MPNVKICKVCGVKGTVPGRRTCDKCTKELARERAKRHYAEKGHTQHRHTCLVCFKDFTTLRKTSQFCDTCRRGIKMVTSYEYSKKATGRLVWRHRELAEDVLGRRLLSSEAVHHVNGVGTDNRLENLMILGRQDHAKLHRYLENQRLLFISLRKASEWEERVEEVTKSWFFLHNKKFTTLRDLA